MLSVFQNWNTICRGKTVNSHLTIYVLHALHAVGENKEIEHMISAVRVYRMLKS